MATEITTARSLNLEDGAKHQLVPANTAGDPGLWVERHGDDYTLVDNNTIISLHPDEDLDRIRADWAHSFA